jgi:predicted ester cyclase
MKTAFPDYHLRIDRMVAEDDKVGAQFTQGGTHEGELMGIAPTGRTVEWTETGILRFEGGKIVETWFESDILGLMQQLGVGETEGVAAG